MKPLIVPSYKLNVVIEDITGRAKIFLFGGVAEQVVRRTAAELVEESSSNQILLHASLRSLVGRRYVFQVVISEQTFRTGQLCFQARKVFTAPTVAGVQSSGAGSNVQDPPGGSSATERSGNQIGDGDSGLTNVALDPEGASTPPTEHHTSTASKNSSAKGKENAPEESGNNLLGKRPRSARKELNFA
ncbi:unnamed protein product, partial [Urochloa humidicola]